MNASEEEMCDDIIIEVQQSSQMIKIYSEGTEEISKTSNNILNNNIDGSSYNDSFENHNDFDNNNNFAFKSFFTTN